MNFQFKQINQYYNTKDKWEKYYDQYDVDLKKIFPELSYKALVKILYKVNAIIEQAKLGDVYFDLKEPIMDSTSLTLNSKLKPACRRIDEPLVSIELLKLNSSIFLYMVLYTEEDSLAYYGYIENIKLFLSYLIYYGRI